MKPLTFKLSAMGTTGTQLFLMNCYYILQKEGSVWLTYKFTHSTTTTTPKKSVLFMLEKTTCNYEIQDLAWKNRRVSLA